MSGPDASVLHKCAPTSTLKKRLFVFDMARLPHKNSLIDLMSQTLKVIYCLETGKKIHVAF